jgi:UDP-glucose 4-epimerase
MDYFVMTNSIKTLVIGGAGYIGSHLVPQLLTTGREVTVLGRKDRPQYELPDNAIYVQGDFSEKELLVNLLERQDEVIHLAYATVPNTSFENPVGDLLQNLPSTVQLFSEVASKGIKLVLVSSGGTVYGEATELPISESHPTHPISPYGVTKLTLEHYAKLYAVTHGLKYVCIRPANAYGVGQRPFVGQGFISTAMASAMEGISIKVFGKHGTVRDYLYVSDVASGIVSALKSGHVSETYNLGSGIGFSNIDIIKKIDSLFIYKSSGVLVENLPARTFDVKENVLDSKKLQDHTGWKPQVEFDEGLNLMYGWLRSIENE